MTRRGLILPVVLVLIGLLAMTLGGFMFFMQAELAGVEAQRDGQQARLAAESGLEEVLLAVREALTDPNAWLDRPEWRSGLVWSEAYDRDNDPVRKGTLRKDLLEAGRPPATWRFSVVATLHDGPPDTMRYGVTPENSRLDLNTASDTEITRLLVPLLLELNIQNAEELVACLLDWREPGDAPRPNGAKDEYYMNLVPGYHCKGAALDSLEELLLVKGWTPLALYGEDVNRNGILDLNEDDGDATFPFYDNGDGVLNRGIAAYATVGSEPAKSQPDPTGGQPQGQLPGDQQSGGQQPEGIVPQGADEAGDVDPAKGGREKGKQADRMQQQGPGQEDPMEALRRLQEMAAEYERQQQQAGQGQQPAPTPRPTQQPPVRATPGGQAPPAQPPPGAPPVQQPGQTPAPGAQGQSPVLGGEGQQPLGTEGEGLPGAPRAGTCKINVNTAPLRVLQCLDGMTEEAAQAIVAMRQQLAPEDLKNPSWPAQTGLVPAAVQSRLTTKATRFRVEILGYGDHTKVACRYEWLIELRGKVAQVLWQKDLTGLGFGWPVDDDSYIVRQ